MISEKFFSFKKKQKDEDQFKAMHHTLLKHGYETKDYKTYHHPGGAKTHLRPNALHRDPETGRTEIINQPTAQHSYSKPRFTNHHDLDKHLTSYHSVKEEAPTNSMGASCSTSGPINTYDPFLKTKKKAAVRNVARRLEKRSGSST